MHDFKYDPLDSNIIFFISGIDIGSRYLYRFDKKTSGVTKLSESGSYFIIDKNNNKNILTENTNLSNDGGWTWHPIKNSLEKLFKDKYSYSSQFVPINIEGSNIYATVINRNEITFIHSDNSGNEWDWKSETHQDITKLYINPKNPSNIILTYKIKENQYSSEYIGLNVTESFDYGKTWKPILNLSEKNNDIFNISKNKYKEEFNLDNFLLSMYTEQTDKPINIYISSPTGLIYTNNEGKTWKKIGGIHENK